MTVLSQNAVSEMCNRAGIAIADSSLGIGRELSYRDGPARTIVVHFVESDFPAKVKETLEGVLPISTQWVLLNRHGQLQAKEFSEHEIPNILALLIESYPKINREGDDLYLLSKNGKVFISYDHHMFDSGLAIFVADIPLAGTLLERLNKMGAEVELFSKNG